jgi:lysophospholipase L1-like esterase
MAARSRSRARRIVWLLAALPVAVAAVLGAQVALALTRDYLRSADFEVDFTTDGSAPTLRLAVVGDSLVEGVGASSARTSLAGQVAQQVADRTGRAVQVRGLGVSGAVTADVLEQLDQLEPGDYDAIVIEVGSNDVTHATRLNALEQHTRLLLERSLQLAPIVVFGSAGRLDTPNFQQPLRQVVVWRATRVRALQSRVAAEFDEVAFMDVARDVSPVYERTPGATSGDGFHPADPGYEVWARPLAALVVERL